MKRKQTHSSIVLPEGDYNFTVAGLKKDHFPGDKKTPPSNMLILTLHIETLEDASNIQTSIILYRSFEWKLCSLFRSINNKNKEKKTTIDLCRVVGATGRAHIIKTNGRNSTPKNEVDYFIDHQ